MKEGTERDDGDAPQAPRDSARAADGDSAPAEFDYRERFEAGASRYADYLQTPEGRLRLDLAWLNLRDALQAHGPASPGRALDAGGGTGALALRLARAGWDVSVVDSSTAMLALAAGAARREGEESAARVHFRQGDAASVDSLFGARSFDLLICHNVIEYVEDPRALVGSLARAAREGALVSLLARNRAGESMRDAVKLQDLDAARHALTAETVRESLYGGPARLFDPTALRGLAAAVGLEVLLERGVRVVSDYLPASFFARAGAYERLLDFEHEVGARPDFASVARYTQLVARAS